MNMQPTLTGELVKLSALLPEDYAALLHAASDPLIWEMHPQPNRYEPEIFKSFFAEALASQGALKICDLKSSEVIGTSRFYDYSKTSNSVVVGYTFLTRAYWGGTYNRDLKKLMVNYALTFVKTVYFQVALGNLRSQNAMLKLGAVSTGIQEIAVSYAPPKKSYVYKIETPL